MISNVFVYKSFAETKKWQSILPGTYHFYTPGIYYTPVIYAEEDIVFVFPFICSFVCSLLSVMFIEFTSKFLVKVSLSEYISLTTQQKEFIFEPWVPERVCFYAMNFGYRVHAPGWG